MGPEQFAQYPAGCAVRMLDLDPVAFGGQGLEDHAAFGRGHDFVVFSSPDPQIGGSRLDNNGFFLGEKIGGDPALVPFKIHDFRPFSLACLNLQRKALEDRPEDFFCRLGAGADIDPVFDDADVFRR